MGIRFYFDVSNDSRLIKDNEGVEADSLEQALADARSVLEELSVELGASDLQNGWTLVVRDETGLSVAHIPLSLFSNL